MIQLIYRSHHCHLHSIIDLRLGATLPSGSGPIFYRPHTCHGTRSRSFRLWSAHTLGLACRTPRILTQSPYQSRVPGHQPNPSMASSRLPPTKQTAACHPRGFSGHHSRATATIDLLSLVQITSESNHVARFCASSAHQLIYEPLAPSPY